MINAFHEMKAPDGKIELTLYKAGLIAGGSGGNCTLTFKGKRHPVSVGGVSLGATIGASKGELVGEVYNMKTRVTSKVPSPPGKRASPSPAAQKWLNPRTRREWY